MLTERNYLYIDKSYEEMFHIDHQEIFEGSYENFM